MQDKGSPPRASCRFIFFLILEMESKPQAQALLWLRTEEGLLPSYHLGAHRCFHSPHFLLEFCPCSAFSSYVKTVWEGYRLRGECGWGRGYREPAIVLAPAMKEHGGFPREKPAIFAFSS